MKPLSLLCLLCLSLLLSGTLIGCSKGASSDSPTHERLPPLPPQGERNAHSQLLIPPGSRLQAKVIHVVDGDTVYLRTRSGVLVKGRLAGINTPECHKQRTPTAEGRMSAQCNADDEAYGLRAFTFLHQRIDGATLMIDCVKRGSRCSTGRYGRPLITLYKGGEDLNRLMVEHGLAFTFTKYPSEKRASYCAAEFSARAAKRGVWSLAPSIEGVLSLMSRKTRRWYQHHDTLCAQAMGAARGESTPP